MAAFGETPRDPACPACPKGEKTSRMEPLQLWLALAIGCSIMAGVLALRERAHDRHAEARIRARLRAFRAADAAGIGAQEDGVETLPVRSASQARLPWPVLAPPGFGRRLPALLAPGPAGRRITEDGGGRQRA